MRETIKLNNFQIDSVVLLPYKNDEKGQPYDPLKSLIMRSGDWREIKTVHWLRRFRQRIIQLAKPFFESKKDLFEQYGLRDREGKLKIVNANFNIKLADKRYFRDNDKLISEMSILYGEIIDIGFYPIKCDWNLVPSGLDDLELATLELLVEPDHEYEPENIVDVEEIKENCDDEKPTLIGLE